jgi:hypothetical protein
MGETRCCPICREPVPSRPGPGRPRTYCGPAHRRLAERRAQRARNWALADPALKALVDPALEVVDLDVDEVNRWMRRMR